MGVRITEADSRVLGQQAAPVERITSMEARAILQSDPVCRVTEVESKLMGSGDRSYINPGSGAPKNYWCNVTTVEARVMYSRVPDFRWIDMLITEVFPFDISFNSIGATRFMTDVTLTDSGDDQRNQRWTQPLMEYDVAYGVRTLEQLQGLLAFFRAMNGRKYSFLYLDHMDFMSSQALSVEARSAPPVHWNDQPLGTGDGLKKVFQLQKKYATPNGLMAQYRPIYKPKASTVLIGQDGNRVLNWTLDDTTGLITFVSRLVLSGLSNIQIDHVTGTTWNIISTVPSTFAGINVGDKILTSGFVNHLNNAIESTSIVVTGTNADRDQLQVVADASWGANETRLSGATIQVHPAPPAGAVLTAGYEFYVPVRFDTDRLPISIEYYGIGTGSDVKLVEVRPNSE